MTKPRIQSADRVTLLLALVPFLIENDGLSVEEIADRFDVSATEIQSLINRLRGMGIPGESGAYLPNDLFQIDDELFDEDGIVSLTHTVGLERVVGLSGHEAASLIAGLQYASAIVPDSSAALSTLIAKLSQGSTGHLANIAVSDNEDTHNLEVLREALASGMQVEISYVHGDGVNVERTVDPFRIDLVNGTWYLRGFCHLRDELRTFRVDRISGLSATTTQRTTHYEPDSLPIELYEADSSKDQLAVLKVPHASKTLLDEFRPVSATDLGDGTSEVSIYYRNPANILQLVALHGGIITISSPKSLQAALRSRAEEAIAKYR